ncbi:hypothetical protein [Corynebacterium sp. HMSC034A01]|uniref:hypothetical protein n=1 Tax=Corynebacterium sp. HMSC034A01 TaxID=1739295 RepID=UPI0008A8AEAD|nr:hypothetical protein [Corynebacterium sp. HMSC034A01]OHR18192.1 hypothetical protein HMPREF2791_00560 [Corynebacterium sp. HMSC034A01]
MNLKNIGFAAAFVNQAWKYLRDQNDKRERDIYQSLLDNLKDGKLDDIHEKFDMDELQELYGAARAQAGEITRDAHDRLDRRRKQFEAAAPSRKERQEFLEKHAKSAKKNAKKKKKGGVGKVIGTTLGTAALAGGAWAAWEFFLKDKLAGENEPAKTYRPAPTRTETDNRGSSTLVYSTRTEDDLEATATTNSTEDLGGEGLTTLDTLADNQRKATSPQHSVEDAAGAQGNIDGGVDGGRHELRED